MALRVAASDPPRFAIAPSNAGPFGDPRAAAELARTAEEVGWDGYFSWDALPMRPDPPPAHDPWVILSAVAMATTRMKIGTCVAVVPRYKPHLLARTLVSLDVLSGGRVIFGVGLGGDGGASIKAFGENGATRARAQKTDEALEIITRLWSEDSVTYRGEHYTVDGFTLSARTVQQPRIPIWVGGDSPAAVRRALAGMGGSGRARTHSSPPLRTFEASVGGSTLSVEQPHSTSRGADPRSTVAARSPRTGTPPRRGGSRSYSVRAKRCCREWRRAHPQGQPAAIPEPATPARPGHSFLRATLGIWSKRGRTEEQPSDARR